MVSNLLSFTIIAVSFSKLSQAAPQTLESMRGLYVEGAPKLSPMGIGPQKFAPEPFYNVARPPLPAYNRMASSPNDAAYYHHNAPPPSRDLLAPGNSDNAPRPSEALDVQPPTSTEIKSLQEYFQTQPELMDVAATHIIAIEHGDQKPLSLQTLEAWKAGTVDYRDLKFQKRQEIIRFLHQWFIQSDVTPELQQKAGAYAWSLSQSIRKPYGKASIWWQQSLVDNNSANNEFIELVKLGDRLKFYNTNPKLTFGDEEASRTVKQLTEILYSHNGKDPRRHALNIGSLMTYKGESGVSMYQARVGQLIKITLKDFAKLNPSGQEELLQDAYLLIGKAPADAIQLAQNAIKKGKSVSPLLEFHPGQNDYKRIETELKILGQS